MQQLSGFPYAEVRYDKDGRAVDPADAAATLGLVSDTAVTDLVVLAHGWNNDMDDARRLYRQLAASLAGVSDQLAGLTGHRIALAGVLWPSKRFNEADLIPGGAAGLATAGPVAAAAIRDQIDELTGV